MPRAFQWTDPKHREIFGDVGVRTALGDRDWVRLVVRPGVRGPVGPFRLAGGIGAFYRINELLTDRLEIRPFQGISVSWPKWQKLRLQHYVRLEERLEWETANWTFDAALRGRYRLQVDYGFSGFTAGSDWRVLLHAEGFVTLLGGSGVEEQIRVGAGVGRNVGSVLRLRVDLTWEKVGLETLGDADYLYIRVRFFQGWLRELTSEDG